MNMISPDLDPEVQRLLDEPERYADLGGGLRTIEVEGTIPPLPAAHERLSEAAAPRRVLVGVHVSTDGQAEAERRLELTRRLTEQEVAARKANLHAVKVTLASKKPGY